MNSFLCIALVNSGLVIDYSLQCKMGVFKFLSPYGYFIENDNVKVICLFICICFIM